MEFVPSIGAGTPSGKGTGGHVQLVLTVGIVAALVWVMALGFALTLAHTAKSADRAGRRLVIPARRVTAPHSVIR